MLYVILGSIVYSITFQGQLPFYAIYILMSAYVNVITNQNHELITVPILALKKIISGKGHQSFHT